MDSAELTASITAVAISISKTFNTTDTLLLAAIFRQLADILAMIRLQDDILGKKNTELVEAAEIAETLF